FLVTLAGVDSERLEKGDFFLRRKVSRNENHSRFQTKSRIGKQREEIGMHFADEACIWRFSPVHLRRQRLPKALRSQMIERHPKIETCGPTVSDNRTVA